MVDLLPLDSQRWAGLCHAYGPASDIPALLERFYAGPTEDDWDDLYGIVTHQGSPYSAAFATAPHVLAASEGTNFAEQAVLFLAFAALSNCERASPQDLAPAYHGAISTALVSAHQWLRTRTERTDIIYWLQAVAALSGRCIVARLIEGLADEEYEFPCIDCEQHVYLPFKDGQLASHRRDPWYQPGDGIPLVPTVADPSPTRPSATDHDRVTQDFGWLLSTARHAGHTSVANELEMLGWYFECPSCGTVRRALVALAVECDMS